MVGKAPVILHGICFHLHAARKKRIAYIKKDCRCREVIDIETWDEILLILCLR